MVKEQLRDFLYNVFNIFTEDKKKYRRVRHGIWDLKITNNFMNQASILRQLCPKYGKESIYFLEIVRLGPFFLVNMLRIFSTEDMQAFPVIATKLKNEICFERSRVECKQVS